MNKRLAIKEVRALADDTIDQLERLERGWDRGDYRDDCFSWDAPGTRIPSYRMQVNSKLAFSLAARFAN